MNIRNYYVEIKNRFLLLVLAWVSVIFVSYFFKDVLLFLIIKQSINLVINSEEAFYFIFTDVTEVFSAYMTLIFFLGNQVFIFSAFYHILNFISLGLYASERKYLVFVFKTSLFLFIFSTIIFNQWLFPLSWNFFLNFQNFSAKSLTLHFEAKLNEYLAFYIMFYYICILYFQVFILLILFLDYVKYKLETIKRFRKFLYYSFVVFATLITPPDISSQFFCSISMILNYEIVMFYSILNNLIRQPIKTN